MSLNPQDRIKHAPVVETAQAGPAIEISLGRSLSGLLDRGNWTMRQMEDTFRCPPPNDRYFWEEVRPTDPAFTSHPSFNWPAGIILSAFIAGAKADPATYLQPMVRYVDAVDSYWFVDEKGLGGLCATPNAKKIDRFYDDNAWLVIDYCDAFDLTQDPAMLERAKKTMAFVLSGEDDKLGGGIYWNEQTPDCKNTCSNGPSAVGALRLYEHTGESHYLDTARRLYDWTKNNLQDPADGLYFDHLKLDGSMEPTKWTYNTALMLRAACLLFKETGEPKYLDDARRMARSAEAHWCTPEGGMKNPGYFCHLLLEAMLELGQLTADRHWLNLANRTCDFLWQHNRDPNGQSPEHWDARPAAPLETLKVMWIASNARTYFHVAQANVAQS